MTNCALPSPAERRDATRLCARHGVQPTDFTPSEWLDMAIEAQTINMPSAYPADAWLAMGAPAERFPGTFFR